MLAACGAVPEARAGAVHISVIGDVRPNPEGDRTPTVQSRNHGAIRRRGAAGTPKCGRDRSAVAAALLLIVEPLGELGVGFRLGALASLGASFGASFGDGLAGF